MSAQFLKFGQDHISTADIRQITLREDGGLIVVLIGVGFPLKVDPGEDADTARSWLDSVHYKGTYQAPATVTKSASKRAHEEK